MCLDTTRTTAIYLIAGGGCKKYNHHWKSWPVQKHIHLVAPGGSMVASNHTTAAHFSGFCAGPYLEYLMSTSWSSLSLPSLAPRRILFCRRSFAIITSTLAAICCSTSVLANTFAAASFGEHVSPTPSHYPLTLHPSP